MSGPKPKNETETTEGLETEAEAPEERSEESGLVEAEETSSSEIDEKANDEIEDAEIVGEDEAPDATSENNTDSGDDPSAEGPADAEPEEISDKPEDDTDLQDADVEEAAQDAETVDADPQPEPEPAEAASTPAPAPVEQKKGGGFFGTFIGGAVAAGLGFGVCYYLVEQGILGGAGEDAFAEDRAQISALQDQVTALQSQIAEGGEDPRVGPLAEGLANTEGLINSLQNEIGTVQSELEAQGGLIASVGDELGTVTVQLEAIAEMPVGTGGADTAAVAALQAQLQAQQTENAEMQAQLQEMAEAARAEMEDVRERAGSLQAETQAAVDEATNRAALANVTSSIESGTPLAPALANITGDVPEALSAVSETGVKTVLELQNAFPAAARAGLSDSLKVTVGDNPTDRIFAFLQAQVGARSLEAREGDDPDAILARAQEAVSAAQFSDALAEIAALPPEGQSAMAGWTSDAQARVDAVAARDALAAELISN